MNENMQEISNEEIDARIMVLISQRNKAMDENVLLAAKTVLLEKQVTALKELLKTTQEQAKSLALANSHPLLESDSPESCTVQ